MVEHTREHARVDTAPPSGDRFTIEGLLPRPIVVFVPQHAEASATSVLLVHFHGAPYAAMHAVAAQREPVVLAAVHLGAGSGVYERAFQDASALQHIRQAIADSLSRRRGSTVDLSTTIVSAFSAGYGAVRALLGSASPHSVAIDGVLLLDGLHVSYVPERTPLASGGALDTARLTPFVDFARRAVDGRARMVVTHSEIFPGTFASTTETSDFLLSSLALTRTPVLEWGPGGMQLLSRTERGSFLLLGFAGNTAPDHIDHYHGMADFLGRLLEMPASEPAERTRD